MPRPAHFAAEAYDTARFAKPKEAVEWWGVSHHRKLMIQMAAVLLALPILYVASSGPVLRLALESHISSESAARFYHPLLAVAGWPVRGDWKGSIVGRYLNFWGVGVGYTTPGSHLWLFLRPKKP